jgi:hypothetical protein
MNDLSFARFVVKPLNVSMIASATKVSIRVKRSSCVRVPCKAAQAGDAAADLLVRMLSAVISGQKLDEFVSNL